MMFQQHQEVSLSEAWTRFKDLLQKVPHHGIDRWLQIQIFSDHVSFHLKYEIDRAADDKIRNKNADESLENIENIALYDHEGWNDSKEFVKPVKAVSIPQSTSKKPDRRLLELEEQINFLLKRLRPTPKPSSMHIPQAYAEAVYSNPHLRNHNEQPKQSPSQVEVSVKEAETKNRAENKTKNKPIKKAEKEEAVKAPSSQLVEYYLKYRINEKLNDGLVDNNRLVLEWEEKIKLQQEKEIEFDRWRGKNFKNEQSALVKIKDGMYDEGEVITITTPESTISKPTEVAENVFVKVGDGEVHRRGCGEGRDFGGKNSLLLLRVSQILERKLLVRESECLNYEIANHLFYGIEEMESSDTREYLSLIQTYFDTHTVDGVFLRDEERIIYEEMLRLKDLGPNTPTGVPYTDDEVMTMVRQGKQRWHILGVGRVLAEQGRDILTIPELRCTHTADVYKREWRGGDDKTSEDEDAGEDEDADRDEDS
uniref:Zinc finger, CCHC-type n=1 Tax=Tanacetum cinerariifolium TaxID=118510 RepID=A0A6L2KLM9_TANCI|nr:zinc finger, CCHC-type [Tanacetum cinerariifolium]